MYEYADHHQIPYLGHQQLLLNPFPFSIYLKATVEYITCKTDEQPAIHYKKHTIVPNHIYIFTPVAVNLRHRLLERDMVTCQMINKLMFLNCCFCIIGQHKTLGRKCILPYT